MPKKTYYIKHYIKPEHRFTESRRFYWFDSEEAADTCLSHLKSKGQAAIKITR